MNILSICGGGCRGIMCLYVLRDIEKHISSHVIELFDYYGASSVGSVIVCAMLISDDGIHPKHTCEELYEKMPKLLKDIFTESYYHNIKTGYGYFGAKYPSSGLESALDGIFGDKKMKDLLKPVCFPCFDGISQKPIYFTRESHGDLLIKDVLRATCAAPSYFDPKYININGVDHTLYDSGIVCNNTALNIELYAEHNSKSIDRSKIMELCLGTGTTYTPQPSNNGSIGWIGSIIGYIFSGYNKNEMYELGMVLDKKNILFVETEIDKYENLDNASNEALDYYITKISKWIMENEENFLSFVQNMVKNKEKNDI